jgi:hypothetical protein
MRAASASVAAEDADDPRRVLVSLTKRPTRALRAQYRWAAAALVLLAAGLGGLGWRLSASARGFAQLQASLAEEARAQVQSLGDPAMLAAPNLVMSLESRLMTLRNQKPPKPPPAPRPILEEIRRLAEVASKHEGVRLVQAQIDIRQPNSVQFSVPDRRTGEEIRLELQQGQSDLAWSETAGGSDQVVRLNGAWTK